MASVPQLLLLLFLLLCSCHYLVARAVDARSIYKALATGLHKAEAVCAEPQVASGTTVPLNHRYGPCSPAPSRAEPTIAELFRRDQLRAEYIHRKFHGGKHQLKQSEVTVPTNLGSALDTLEYVVTVGIGSPAVSQTMMIDTGSDVSWVQCKPCPAPPCHATNGSVLFDPIRSKTYAPFSCTSAPCTHLGFEGNGCCGSKCQYIVMYADGSNTTGTYGSDTLALTASETVTGFQFGCSHDEEGFDDQTDGLLGLGGGEQSLVSQTEAKYGKAFSYCLPATSSSSGFLTLCAPNDTSGFVTTPMLRSEDFPTFYWVLLQDIAVEGKPLGISPIHFADGSLMDSGTIVTWLPPAAYSALSSAFKAGMTQYTPAEPLDILDTCFNFTGLDTVTIPSVALVFDGGAVVDLDFDGILIDGCLAFTATTDDRALSVIGNVQQRTFEVLYDVGQSVFGFRSGAC